MNRENPYVLSSQPGVQNEPAQLQRMPSLMRWFASILYASLLVFFAQYSVHAWQRATLAEELSRIALEERPADVPTFARAIAQHLERKFRWDLPPGSGEPESIRIFLKKGKGLFLSVDVEPSTEIIRQIRILWAESKELPLDDPASELPKPAYLAMLHCVLALCWLSGSSTLRPGPLSKCIDVLVVVMLLPMGLFAFIYFGRMM